MSIILKIEFRIIKNIATTITLMLISQMKYLRWIMKI